MAQYEMNLRDYWMIVRRRRVIIVVATLAVMYFAGVRWTHFAVIGATLVALVAIVLVVAPAVGVPVLKGYQKDRLTAFLHKNNADPRSQGYQLNQAQTAIGSGRKTGRGFYRYEDEQSEPASERRLK